MSYRVFIAYSSEDDDKARYIHNCLARIKELVPYKAEQYPELGEDFKQRLQRHLQNSHFMVALLTENGRNSQWVNQEIGYAYALKAGRQGKYANLPHIIPISHKQVELKGFITKDTIDILFLENYPSFHTVITEIVGQIRWRIPRGLENNVLHLRVTCLDCVSNKGLPFEWISPLPAHEEIQQAIQSNKFWLPFNCPQCKASTFVDVRTCLSHKTKEG